MRYISVIFLLFSFIAASQNNCNYAENEVVDLFNKINKTDKSNLNNPEIRRNDFYNNFDTIIYLMNCSDFEIKNGNYTKREKQKIKDGIRRTLIHIIQVEPSKILNDSIIELFALQLSSSNLDNSDLKIALSVYLHDHKNKLNELQKMFNKALSQWVIKEEELLSSE